MLLTCLPQGLPKTLLAEKLYLQSFHLLWQTQKTDTNLVAIVTKAVFSNCCFCFYDSIVVHYGSHMELSKNILCALCINQFDASNWKKEKVSFTN